TADDFKGPGPKRGQLQCGRPAVGNLPADPVQQTEKKELMASRHFYFQLILRVLLILGTSLALAFGVAWEKYTLAGFLGLLLGLQVHALIVFVNSTNRKLAYFFDAIRNEDFTLRFPEQVSIKSFKELNSSLNRVNGLIQEVHLQMQLRERYYQEILKQASIGIMTYNERVHILFANPTLETL